MSKSKNRSRHTRVSSRNATRSVRLPVQIELEDFIKEDLQDLRFLSELQDNRQKFSDPVPKRINSKRVRLEPRPIHRDNFDYMQVVPAFVGFEEPASVITCVRRKQRKQVLHAKRKTGKSGQKRPRRNRNSEVRC